ncbi:MAG: hypothetical protein JWO49_2506, partial [Arthrobacter sp.]|nr:hypothetical protein [Arthrobacter sp.]
MWDRFGRHGVPVLPDLGGPGHAGHGITAAPVWGSGDLGAA